MTTASPAGLPWRALLAEAPGTAAFLALRRALTPYGAMAAHLPGRGRFLDLGCGHGLLALTAAAARPGLEVLGVDHDAPRVAAARRLAARAGLENVRFEEGALERPPAGPFDAVALIDLLHYFDPALQEAIVARAAALLAPGGLLLAREVDPDGGAVAAWNLAYERLVTRVGFTRTARRPHHFRARAGWAALLAAQGLEVEARRCSSALFADVLYVGRRGVMGPRGAAPGTPA